MENKNKFWKGVLVGTLVTAFSGLIIVGVSAGIFVIGKTVIEDTTNQVTSTSDNSTSQKLEFTKIDKKITRMQKIIDKYYLFDEDMGNVEDGIYRGFISGLNDPYSVYYNEEDYQSLVEETSGTYCGIGVMINQDRTTGVITVIKVFPGSPGLEAGIQPGDMIYKVEEVEVTGMELDLLVKNHIKGEEGTPVTITVFRPSENDYIDLTMNRASIEVPTVEYQMLEDNTGYIIVSQFDALTGEQFKSAIQTLEQQNMEKLIVDLRGNPGGLLDVVVDMLDYVLPDGLLVYTEDKNGNGDKYYSKDGHQVDLPIAVLVNGNSASASEVFAGAIKDFEWGTLVGTTTFGKGIVQNIFTLDEGTAVKLTIAHYFTPSGYDLHGKGIEPDVIVELDDELKTKVSVELEDDNQLQEAIRILNGQ